MYSEEGLQFYLANVEGYFSLHTVNSLPINKERINHLQDRFDCLVYTLMEKGWDHLDTWIPPENLKDIKFAEHFGFVPTGWDRVIHWSTPEGIVDQRLMELRLEFPTDENLNKKAA